MKKHPATSGRDGGDLFENLFANVTPLPAHGRVTHTLPRVAPVPLQRLRDEREVLADSLSDEVVWDVGVETGEELVYLRDGLDARTLKKLRRGHWVIQDELDLHGLTAIEARVRLGEFLHACLRRGARCVRIVHGKGLRSKNRQPVLKTKVAKWLMLRDEVLAFCQARQVDGGGGAVMVLLKAA